MDFDDIFAEYYAQFRGQGTTIPVFGEREYTTAIYLANAGIKKWDRVDGELWRELMTTAAEQTTGVWATLSRSLIDGTLTYPAPTNMRKPPAFVRIGTTDYPVIKPYEAQNYTADSSIIWFSGGANTGYTMHVGSNLATNAAGSTIDYIYIKKPTLFTIATTPAAQIPDMSDPGFLIAWMLRLRFKAARNGMGFKISDADAKEMLMAMRIENSSGTWGNSDNFGDLKGYSGWGVNKPVNEIKL